MLKSFICQLAMSEVLFELIEIVIDSRHCSQSHFGIFNKNTLDMKLPTVFDMENCSERTAARR